MQHLPLLAKQPCPFSPHYPDVKRPAILWISESFQTKIVPTHDQWMWEQEQRGLWTERAWSEAGQGFSLVKKVVSQNKNVRSFSLKPQDKIQPQTAAPGALELVLSKALRCWLHQHHLPAR